MWKNYVARGRALLGWRRMACALAAKVAGSRAHGLQRLRKRTDGSDARAFKRSILRGLSDRVLIVRGTAAGRKSMNALAPRPLRHRR